MLTGQKWVHAYRWMRIALLNLVVVAAAGLILRYKIALPLPVIGFKNLLHAHSHFAFSGWISIALFALIIALFIPVKQHARKKFAWLFAASQITSYGMLISFMLQGYGLFSIICSTAFIVVTYIFTIVIWKETKPEARRLAVKVLRIALLFLCLSSLGPYMLAYLRTAHVVNSELYHNSVYWYLHFQYNGWFSFAVFALFLRMRENVRDTIGRFRLPYHLMLVACIPVYLLSILWIEPPLWVYVTAGLGAALQLSALVIAIRRFNSVSNITVGKRRTFVHSLFVLAALSFCIKLLLQFLSVFPQINQFVFGHRPIIIGYLHLVMLGFVTFFIIGVGLKNGFFSISSRVSKLGGWLFFTGVILNEIILLVQGFAGIIFTAMTWAPLVLVAVSLIMLVGISLFAAGQWKASRNKKLHGTSDS